MTTTSTATGAEARPSLDQAAEKLRRAAILVQEADGSLDPGTSICKACGLRHHNDVGQANAHTKLEEMRKKLLRLATTFDQGLSKLPPDEGGQS